MKIIHTADWHLGQTFYEFSRKREHLRFLDRLKSTVKERGIDVLLIAGDVFDSANPSAESQSIYYSFLRDITYENPDLQIIIIAGNHDSALRLEAPNPLLECMNITVRGVVKRDENGDIDYRNLIIPLTGGGYCIATPYLRQGDCPEAENYSEGVKKMYDNLYRTVCDEKAPVIAMGHLHLSGAELSENDRSERTVIGGLECASPDSFAEGFDYVALGHLHRYQKVGGRDNIRYSGSPIPMSFSEKNNRQGVVFVEIADGTVGIERIEFTDTARLVGIGALPLNDVFREIAKLPDGDVTDSSPYLEIKVLQTEPEPSMRHQIEEALKGKSVRLACITAETRSSERDGKEVVYEELHNFNPAEIADKVFERKYGGEMSEKMKILLNEVIKEVCV
ncbi:MAG: exonuclease SbcCD subunit D C-terminal domain-containing protein [Tannerella sp.]|jgi:exonuclease SbcD|nr:exonuclease SbcCD subunit D C-terminal domain-containing protein [Tannerella sp.]